MLADSDSVAIRIRSSRKRQLFAIIDSELHIEVTSELEPGIDGYLSTNIDALLAIGRGTPSGREPMKFYGAQDTSEDYPYSPEEPVATYVKYLPRRMNCTLSWLIHQSIGPFGPRSVLTEVEDGIPTSITIGDNSLTSAIELTLSFRKQVEMRAGWSDGLEILDGAEFRGDIEDAMCMAGLVNSEEWLRAINLPPAIARTMIRFDELCQSESRSRLLDVYSLLARAK